MSAQERDSSDEIQQLAEERASVGDRGETSIDDA